MTNGNDKAKEPKGGDLIYRVEVAGPNNDRVLFPPTSTMLRGRWSNSAPGVATADKSAAMKAIGHVAVIPGMVIELNVTAATAIVVDPLESGKGKEILDAVNRASDFTSVFGKQTSKTADTYDNLSIDRIKDFGYWMARLVEGGLAENVGSGPKIPETSEISELWPGKRLRDPLNTGREGKESRPLGMYTDEVAAK